MTKQAAATLKLGLVGQLLDALGLGDVKFEPNYTAVYSLTNGAGAGQIGQIYADRRTIGASGSENLDLAGGVLDPTGSAITFTKVKALIIRASDGNTNDVVVGGHASAAWATPFADATDKVKVKPGGLLVLVAPGATGYGVTATTGDLLTVANSGSGTGVTYDIFVLGATA